MATSTKARGGYATGTARRRQILDAAMIRFGQDGYRKTSLARVARDAGITDAGLLHHFRDKQALLLAVIEHWHTSLDENWLPLGASVREAFRAHLEQAAQTQAMPGIIELAVVVGAEATSLDHPAHSLFRKWQEKGVAELAQRLAAGETAGELRPGPDWHSVARELVAVEEGLRLQWLTGDRAFDLVDMVRAHLDRLIRSISANGEGLE